MPRLLLLLFLVTIPLSSQTKVDSLLSTFKLAKEDSLKTEIYRAIGVEYMRTDQEKALEYFSKAEKLSLEKGLKSSLAKSRHRKGTVYRNMNLHQQSKEELDAALSIFIQLNDPHNSVYVKIEQATLLKAQSNFEGAINLYLEALSLTRKTGDTNSEARIHNYIGSVYSTQKQYNKALEHYKLALVLVKALNFKPGISACFTNLASTYSSMENYERAIYYHTEALKLKQEIGDKLGMSRVLDNLGGLYNIKQEYDIAAEHYQQAYGLAKEVGNLKEMANVQYGLADNAFRRNDFGQCIALAHSIIDDLPTLKNLELSIKVHKLIANAFKENGSLQKALDHFSLYHVLSDSLYNENILSTTNNLEAKYQNEQKTKEIALLSTARNLQTLQLEKRVIERNAIIALALIMLIMAGLLYNQFRVKLNANRKLQELDRLKSHFFANISHEFRTPLTLIKGPIEQLEQNPDEKLSIENVKMIRRNANRVLTLVNQLLDLSRIDGGSLKLEPTEGDICKFLRAAAASFNSHAAQRNIDYKVKVPPTVLWTSFDRDKLEKIVYNLLGNAFKFSDDGSIISFVVTFDEGDLKIQVADTGMGIAEERLPFIFDRFYQVDKSYTKEKEGSGIGLSLSKDLVKLMDGTITVSSEVGKGTFFIVQLPFQEIRTRTKKMVELVHPLDEIQTKPTTYELSKADVRNIPNILIVEDNRDMRYFIKEHLIGSYRINEAVNGEIGLQKAIENPPDLIIADLMMPKMDGIELCKRIKTNVYTSHIPVIMLTAKAGMENRIEGLETGADDYLTKPFEPKELLARAKNLVNQRQQLRELFTTKGSHIDPKKITVTSIDQKFLGQVLALLEKRFFEPDFGMTEMQKALAMSKTQLHRKLKALTNEAPGELLRNFRLKKAAQLLAQKEDTVTQIAYKVGFNNLSYFAKCFKEMYGVAPSSY